VVIEGPLAPFAAMLVEHLDAQGYGSETVIRKIRLVGKLSRFLHETGRVVEDLGTAATLTEFVGTVHFPRSDRVTATTLTWVIEFLLEKGEIAPALPSSHGIEDILGRYRHYLIVERGLVPKTAASYERVAQLFLLEHPEGELANLSPAAVARYVTRECRRLDSVRGAERMVTVLRSLLTFALLEGLISSPLSSVVPSVARWGGASLPRGLTSEQVAAMLATCERDRTKGMRNYAILVLLSRLGLRAAEVAGLRLEDIDWHAGEIVVHGKGRADERLPLPSDVGEAVGHYLRHGRPDRPEERAVFLRLLAPVRGLAPQGVSDVVLAASERAGLGSFGAHRLRHTAGTEMLRAGATLSQVAQVLRHRSVTTTAIYAKVDHLALRQLATPWPGTVR
jgi:site-specific recombinase XerD